MARQATSVLHRKLFQLAQAESDGRKEVNLKEFCKTLAVKFRVNHKDIYEAFKEYNSTSQKKFGSMNRFTFKFDQ